jgi:uncharacterized protein YkwD
VGRPLTTFVLALTAAAALALPGGLAPPPASAAATSGGCTPGANWGTLRPDLASAALDLVNQHRVSLGLKALKVSAALTASAQWKSLHMAYYQYFSHYDLNYPTAGAFRDPFTRMADCGYSYNTFEGENIAYGYSTASAVVSAWLSDSGHRANIEGPSYVVTGIAAAADSSGAIFWTQDFGGYDDSGTTTAPFTPGAIDCDVSQMVAHAPVVYGTDPSSSQYIVWRTDFWHYNGSSWQLAGSTPYLLSIATAAASAQQWWRWPDATYVGTSSQVALATTTVPPGGTWLATQELYRLNQSGQLVSSQQVLATGVSGPNAVPSADACAWASAAASSGAGSLPAKAPAPAIRSELRLRTRPRLRVRLSPHAFRLRVRQLSR